MTRLPVLGELESEVMRIVWRLGAASVKEVAARLTRERAYTTVQTTMDRLYRKSLLSREKQSHSFMYRARVTRAEYHRKLLSSVVRRLFAADKEPVLAAFVDLAASADLKNLERLEQLIEAKRESEGRSR